MENTYTHRWQYFRNKAIFTSNVKTVFAISEYDEKKEKLEKLCI